LIIPIAVFAPAVSGTIRFADPTPILFAVHVK